MQEDVLAILHLQPISLITQPSGMSATQAVLYQRAGMRSLQLPAMTSLS